TRFSRDWSSDVCSSDLVAQPGLGAGRDLPTRDVPAAVRAAAEAGAGTAGGGEQRRRVPGVRARAAGAAGAVRRPVPGLWPDRGVVGRASCRERVDGLLV